MTAKRPGDGDALGRSFVGSEELYHAVVDAMAEGIAVQNADAEIVTCNAAAERILGLTADQMRGRTSLDPRWRAVRPSGEDWPGDTHPAIETLRTGKPITGAVMGVHKPTDRLTWVSINTRPLHDPADGRLVGVVVSFADITEQVDAEQALRASGQQMRDVLTTIRLPAVVLDTRGRIIFVNHAHAVYADVDPDALEGRDWLEVFAVGDTRGDRDRAFPAELRADGINDYTAPIRTHTGEERMMQWHNVALRDADGVVYGSASIGADVTEQIALQSRLRDSELRRERVLAELLRLEAEERARIASDLHDDSVQVMVATLITLDRLVIQAQAGGEVAMADTAGQARELLALAVERTRNLMFELRPPWLAAGGIEPALRGLIEQGRGDAGWQVTVEVRVGRHEEQIEQLVYRTVLEALTNVRRHAQATRVDVAVSERDGLIHGRVQDDGRGFDVERAIERARASAHLGLDTMIERVRLAGGELWFDSAPGRGTQVHFTIPVPRSDLKLAGGSASSQ